MDNPKLSDLQSVTYFASAGRSSYSELNQQLQRNLDDPCVKVVLESVSGFLMILNEQRQIITANQELLDALAFHDQECMVGLRPGEALNCIHFSEGPNGCGTSPHCRACGAVLAILASQSSSQPVTEECHLSLWQEGKIKAREFRVRATPLELSGCRLTAFVLYDISAEKRREVLEETFLHDYLNLLGGIGGWSELLKQVDRDTAAREIVALAESLREGVLSQRTLLDAEKGSLLPKPREFKLAELYTSLRLLFEQHPVAHGMNLVFPDLEPEIRLIADRSLLLRFLTNALKNAFEASAPSDTVSLRYHNEAGSPVLSVHNPRKIPDDVQLRLFERSFSTKTERGHGLGTYSMKLYGETYLGGKVWFTSDVLQGTEFFLRLPEGAAPASHASPSPESPDTGSPGLGSLLIVDDDERLLRLNETLLGTLGYSVTCCRSGAEALNFFDGDAAQVRGVITDMSMPGMSGLELARALRAIRPDLPVLLCTGRCEQPEILKVAGIAGILMKPYNLQELAEGVERMLNSRNPQKEN